MLTTEEKRKFLRAIEEDIEFRYAVAGLLGYGELLKRLDAIGEEQARLREEQVKIWEEIRALREEQARLREEQVKIWEEIRALREEQARLREEQVKIWEEIRALREEQARLREEQVKIWEEIRALREEQVDIRAILKNMDRRLTRVERTLDKLTLDVEEEAREVVGYRLKEMGIHVELERLELPGLEVNLYGVTGDVCVIGEATVRLGRSDVEELSRKAEQLASTRPDLVRPKVILVAYTSLATLDAIDEAKRRGVWVLKATKDLVVPSSWKS